MYFADLLGGGIGCVVAVVLLLLLSGPSSVILTGALACVASALFFRSTGGKSGLALACALGLALVTLTVINEVRPVVAVRLVKSYEPNIAQVVEKEKV